MGSSVVRCGAGISVHRDPVAAAEEACASCGLPSPDLAIAFLTPAYAGGVGRALDRVAERLSPKAFLGLTAAGVISGRREIEEGPALAVWAGAFEGGRVSVFYARARGGAESYRFDDLPEVSEKSTVLLFPDPYTTPVGELLGRLGGAAAVLGGVVSGATRAGGNHLRRDGEHHRSGCVGAVLEGVDVRPAVSQGCRPIGRPFVVTRAEENVIHLLAGRPAVERLQEVVSALSPDDKKLIRGGIHVGLVMEEAQERYAHGDFLIRNVLGVDPDAGALAISDQVRVGQTLQFHVRDASSAREDLDRILSRASESGPVAGALLFSCGGRGSRFFGEPDVDARIVQERLGPLPLAGFFAGGEIGPVGRRSHLHGYTASLALFGAGAAP